MKNSIQFIILVISFNLSAQTSTFYGNYNVNQNINANVNINKKVDVSGNINKTITTIDYGQLAAANAQREANRLSSMQYANDLNRQQALEIANDPNKAFTYGRDNNWVTKGDIAKKYGFRKMTFYHKIPNQALFQGTYNYRNQSEDGIITEIEIIGCYYFDGLDSKDENVKSFIEAFKEGAEEYAKFKDWIVGEVTVDGSNLFIHNKDINRATVFSIKGFKGTVSYEDDYEYVITDNYIFY